MEKRTVLVFWLKPILALYLSSAFGQEEKVAIIYLIVYCFMDGKHVSCFPYMGLIGTIIISLLAQFGDKMVSQRHDGLLSSFDLQRLVNLSLPCSVCIYPEAFIIRFLLCFGFFLQFPKSGIY